MGRDPAEGDVFAAGVKSGQEALYLQDQNMPGVLLLEGLKGTARIRVDDKGGVIKRRDSG